MDEAKICVGIDLGTTNTSVAISRLNTDGQVKLSDCEITQRKGGGIRKLPILPSILYRKPDGTELVGAEAKEYKESNINAAGAEVRYLENTKRDIGKTCKYQIDGQTYTPVDVAAKILSHIKKFSSIKDIRGDYYTVITVPANFNNDQRLDTLEAARRAGFQEVSIGGSQDGIILYDEPKAAILGFLHEESECRREERRLDVSEKKRILVIDIGGGTCDICVEDVVEQDGQYVFAHKAVGRENLGGLDFDRFIGDDLAKHEKLRGVKLTKAEVASLCDMGQMLKESLSDEITYFIEENELKDFYKDEDWLDKLEDKIDLSSQTREIGGQTITFELGLRQMVNAVDSLICDLKSASANKEERELNKNMEALIDTTLSDHHIERDSIDVIFLTGGMAKFFPLLARLYEIFQKPIVTPSDPLLAVSRGAALYNKYRSVDKTGDIMPNAIMLEMRDGRLKTLVEMGEHIPVEDKQVEGEFSTTSWKGVSIRLYEGKNEFDSRLRRFNSLYTIKFDELLPPGTKFTIRYTVDETKCIRFQIDFPEIGKSYDVSGQIKEDK